MTTDMDSVTIHRIEVLLCELPLLSAHSTATGSVAVRQTVLVRVDTGAAEGWGECPALPEPTYTSEYAEGAYAVLVGHLVPRLLAGASRRGGLSLASANGCLEAVEETLAPIVGHPMARFGLESALLDAALQVEGRSMAAYLAELAGDDLAELRRDVEAGATVSLSDTPEAAAGEARELVRAGYRHLKLKIAPGRDLPFVDAAQHAMEELGVPRGALTVDANGSYHVDSGEHRDALRDLDERGLAAIEQPTAADDLHGLATVASELATTVLADESASSPVAVMRLIESEACDAVSLKPARLGSSLSALAVLRKCRAAGVGVSLGGLLETGIGRAVALAYAALPSVTLPGDLGPSGRYFETDVSEPHVMAGDGTLRVPDLPGAGARPRLDVVASSAVRRASLGREP